MTAIPQGEPLENLEGDGPRIEMHGESHDSSTFIQIGTQIIQPLPPSELEVRYSLLPDTAAFTGRKMELDRIAASLADASRTGRVVAIHAIDGMPGVGKTALAVRAAHLLRAAFPDRQLFINLHSHTPGQDPMRPDMALAGLLTAVGVDARYLPEDLEGRISLWRDRMADQRVLLVLDNAASSAQVAPLLPGSEGCLVLVTSRRHLGDLPGVVVPILLNALPPGDAQAMFLQLAPSAAQPTAEVAELVRLAGYLPLAISLLARVYSRHPSWTLADLTLETRASLLTLAAEKDSVAAAFDVSYRYLKPGQQQFFRRLGLHPGTTVDAPAAAALADVPLQEAARQLDALHGEGLLSEPGHRRYGMHDLIRLYVRDLAATDPVADRDHGLERLLDYYQHSAALVEVRLARQSRTRTSSPALLASPASARALPDRALALSWARTERANLIACLDHATRAGQHARVVGLTSAVAALLRDEGLWTDAIDRHAAAVEAARHVGDPLGEANALDDLGIVQRLTGNFPAATQALQEALRIYRDIDDRLGQANALKDLGVVQYLTDDYLGASQALQEALRVYRDIDDRLGQASALGHLGPVRQATGDYASAAQALETALSISRDIEDPVGQATALNLLGIGKYLTGDYPGATQALQETLGIYRDLDDRLGLAKALNYIGVVRWLTGDYPGATQALAEALDIYTDLGDRVDQATALNYMGVVRRLTGDYPGATQALKAALQISHDIGDQLSQANALNYMGAVRRLTGDYPGAAQALEAALQIYRSIGDRGGEVEALNEIGTLHRVRGDLDQAGGSHRRALDLSREIGSSWDEAHALAGLGRCALSAGDSADAEAALRQAQEIFERIGAAEAAGVTAELDALNTP